MGIRFRCHHCEHELHVKDFQGGRRGRCPECHGRFRVPSSDAEHSLNVEEDIEPSSFAAHDSEPLAASKPSVQSVEPEAAVEADLPPPVPALTAASGVAAIQALLDAPDSQWYVRAGDGEQYGPASTADFELWLKDDRVAVESYVWREGWASWQVAGEVFADYFAAAGMPSVPAENSVPAATSVPAANSVAASENDLAIDQRARQQISKQQTATAEPASPFTHHASSENARLAKKRKQKRNYIATLAALSVLTMVLVVALIVVLMRQ